jgi:phage recombination protein Bet
MINRAAPQTYNRPPSQVNQNPSRCGNDHIAASGFNQSKNTGNTMNKVMTMPQSQDNLPSHHFNQEQVEILKNSICKGATNDEFAIFLMACQKTQLDPFMKQIYSVKRYDNRLKRETMTIQTGIDGYRLIAERTGCYAPGPKNTFDYDADGRLVSATAYVKKLTRDGTWHVVEGEAYFDEYCQTYTDKATGQKKSTGMWGNMQRNQLAKCAESLALRKAFPAELSGVYTQDEMKQAEYQDVTPNNAVSNPVAIISQYEADELLEILNDCDVIYKMRVLSVLQKEHKIKSIYEIPVDLYHKVKSAALLKKINYQESQKRIAEQKEEAISKETEEWDNLSQEEKDHLAVTSAGRLGS